MDQNNSIQPTPAADPWLASGRMNNRDIVLAYVEAEGEGIQLTSKQQQLHDDWAKVDELLRDNVGKKRRGEIVGLIMRKCQVSRATAFNYIIDAQYVFGSLTRIDKQYFIQNRIEVLERRIKQCMESGDDKSAAAYEKSLVKYIEMYPDNRKNESPRTLILAMGSKEDLEKGAMPIEDAEFIIENALKQLPDATAADAHTKQADTAE
jgi:hypothetical protein